MSHAPPIILSTNNSKGNSNITTLTIDKEKYLVSLDGEECEFPRKEFEIIYLLCSVPGKVFSRKDIYKHVWRMNSDSPPRTIEVHFTKIRKCLGKEIIKTIKGVGYKIDSTKTSVQIINR